jgi:hypothetical protein
MNPRHAHTRAMAALCILLAFSALACLRSAESSLRPPETPILTGGLGWALVKESYVRLKEMPTASASDLDHLRRGSVLEVESRAIGDAARPEDQGLWYRLKADGASGWVRETELELFRTEEQAERAGAAIK